MKSLLLFTILIFSSESFAANYFTPGEYAVTVQREGLIAEAAEPSSTAVFEIKEDCDGKPCPSVKTYIGAYVGTAIGVNANIQIGKHFIVDLGGQAHKYEINNYVIPQIQNAYVDPQDYQDTKESFTAALRLAMLSDTFEAGVRYQTMDLNGMTQDFKNQFRSLGYDVQVNLFKGQAGKLYLGISGMKSSAEPSLFRIGGVIRLR